MTDFVLGVDLDGVCGDYFAAFRTAVARERGVEESSLTDDVSWDFIEWDLDSESFLDIHRRAVAEHRMFLDMPAMEGVSEALWRLSDAGVWIRIVTHRLVMNWDHRAIVSDTVEWLDSNSIPYRDICFLGRKPEVQADAYVEDAPHNIEALRGAGNSVIAFEQSYNRHIGGLRARNWVEVEEIVADLVAQHQGAFEGQLPGFDAGADRLYRHQNR
ncbi:MAG: hypothetical protein V9F03_02550 [Microthrixaceae bacterium]